MREFVADAVSKQRLDLGKIQQMLEKFRINRVEQDFTVCL